MVRVLVVDDQEAYRNAMVEVVAAPGGFGLAGAVDCGDAAVAAADELLPDLVLIDKRMNGTDGHEETLRVIERRPALVVVIVSVEDPDPAKARSAGAAAAINKRDLSPERL